MKYVLALIAFTLLSGCGSVPYKTDLAKENMEKLDNSRIYANLTSNKLGAQYNRFESHAAGAAGVSAGALGGLLVGITEAIVNESRETDAEDAINKLREVLESDALEKAYQKQYQQLITQLPQLADNEVKVLNEWPSKGIKSLSFGGKPAFLVLSPDYSLTPSNRMLHVFLSVELYEPKKGKKPSLLYRNKFLYQSRSARTISNIKSPEEIEAQIAEIKLEYKDLPSDTFARNKAIIKRDKKIKAVGNTYTTEEAAGMQAKVWLENDAALLKQYMHEGVEEVFSMFAFDLVNNTELKAMKTTEVFDSPTSKEAGRKWHRLADNWLKGVMISMYENDPFLGVRMSQGQKIIGHHRQ
ncbi:hypothetical protein [Shewanella sp. TC10]|uniref:hypothetical protein n=1 Tax=Shewanella sp. TC10 TaxID=1419739 RepID=UPI00129EEF0D|nr:hypothetical protein [Shewanella sp. TC10]